MNNKSRLIDVPVSAFSIPEKVLAAAETELTEALTGGIPPRGARFPMLGVR